MTKTILVMAISATLILGTFTMSSAFAVFDEPGTYAIKTKSSDFSCETTEEIIESCGKLRSQFRVEIEGMGPDKFTGTSQVQIDIKTKIVLGSLDGDFVLGNPNDIVLPAEVTFQNNELTIEGELVDKNGNHFDLLVIGDNIQEKKKKSTIDLRMTITGDNGFTAGLVQSGIIFVPVGGR